jgi:hypothetical protein
MTLCAESSHNSQFGYSINFLINPKFPDRYHKKITSEPALSQSTPVLIPTLYLSKIHFNIVVRNTQRSANLSGKCLYPYG